MMSTGPPAQTGGPFHFHRRMLGPPAVLLAVFLFAGGPGYRSPRSLCAAWDLGHLAAFSLWSYLLVTCGAIREISPARQWGIVLAFCLVAGAASEGIQTLLGGDASIGDLLRDMAGGAIALSWFSPSSKVLPAPIRRAARTVAATLLLVACLPLAAALSDEEIARLQFPVLSDFETPFEAGRWYGGARFSVDRSLARHGKASLRVEMDVALHSGVELAHFPRDWRGYRFLRLEAFNPSPEEIDLTCRIHDLRHEKGEQRYEDRFNKAFRLRPGWNSLRIDLEAVARAPAGRKLDLGSVRAVGIFATRLPAPRTVFLDQVRLERSTISYSGRSSSRSPAPGSCNSAPGGSRRAGPRPPSGPPG
jgi:VanZ family protein